MHSYTAMAFNAILDKQRFDMINFDKALINEIGAVARANTDNLSDAADLFVKIHEALKDIEREDDRNGTNELGRLLEEKSIATIAKEHDLVPDVSNELSL